MPEPEIKLPPKPYENHTLWASTLCAARGFVSAVRSEKKVRHVVIAATAVTAACVVADVGYFQILMIVFSWILALICEMFNTALEKALDYSGGKEWHPLIRDGKDYASACTFVSVLFASLLSISILWDRLFR